MSQQGQWFWGGTQATITTPASTFTAARHGGGIQVTTQGANTWTVILDPPAGQQLALGTYQNASYAGSPDASHGQITLLGDGRECLIDWGTFTVLDLAIDASQNVTQFAADLEAHCDAYEPAVYAGIRFNSGVAYTTPSIGYAGPASIQWVTQTGNSLFSPVSGTYTRADGVFNTRTEEGGTVGVHLWPYELHHPSFDFEIKLPGTDQVVPGTYENAQGLMFNATHPGIGITYPEDCGGYVGGRFIVYEIEYDPIGHVSKLAADFEEHCYPQTGGIFGGVRFNSTRAYTPPADVNSLPAYLYVMDNQFSTVLRNTTIPGPRVQPVDGNRHAMPGVRVRFESIDNFSCGSFSGATTVDVISDSNGVAQMPPFLAGNFSRTTCEVYASIPGTGVFRMPIDFRIYAETEVVTTALPSQSIVVNAGQPIHVGIRGTASSIGLINTQATFSVIPGTGQAMPASLGISAITDEQGEAYVDGIAGPYEGTFSIVATISGSSQTINVIQHGVAAPTFSTAHVQDMWWVGPSENGWGMSLVEHGNTLFGALYIYDANGNPTWLVMPGGTWDAARLVYSGSLYAPTGSPFYAYDPTHFTAGNAKGAIKITFEDANNAIVDYTINGVTGRKFLTREIFADGSATAPSRSDLWWGGMSQNGWGITVLQQASTLFAVWYTYDANGAPLWYVMPGGTWSATDTYEGHLYRTTGSPWVGATYNPASLQVFDAGTFKFQFNGDNATFTYTADGHSGTIPLVKEPF